MEGEKLFQEGKYQEAYDYFIKTNDSLSNYYLGYMFENGIFVVKNYEKSIEHYLKGKEEIQSLLNLGYIYEQGLGVSVDLEKSIQFYQEAAEKDCPQALNSLGFIYKRMKKMEEAIKCYEKSVDLGNLTAMYNLGKLYQFNLKDIKKGMKYYEIGAKNKDIECLYALGNIYYEGKDVKQDLIKAIEIFKEAREDPGANQAYREIHKKLGIKIEESFKKLEMKKNEKNDEILEKSDEEGVNVEESEEEESNENESGDESNEE